MMDKESMKRVVRMVKSAGPVMPMISAAVRTHEALKEGEKVWGIAVVTLIGEEPDGTEEECRVEIRPNRQVILNGISPDEDDPDLLRLARDLIGQLHDSVPSLGEAVESARKNAVERLEEMAG